MWALVGVRFFKGIPSGQGDAALKLCRQAGPVRVTNAEGHAITTLVS